MAQPFFSIGITTYNRHELLREALDAILSQDFSDFEVIVGNDYQAEVLTGEMLGISDSRIRIVNHPKNLREIGNMNALLVMASGRYFTWLFDDDLYEPGFLRAAHEALLETGFPPALFPSYRVVRGAEASPTKNLPFRRPELFTGREYLARYFSGRAKLISTCGLFEIGTLRSVIGGMEELSSSPIGLYSEFLFLVRCAMLERIAYLDIPFVIFRAHASSWGETNLELPTYLEAGEQLIRRSSAILSQASLRQDYAKNFLGVSKIHLATFCFAAVRVEIHRGTAGILAIYKAAGRVFRELSRVRRFFSEESLSTRIRLNLGLLPIAVKCAYLVSYSVAYYWWRNRKDKAADEHRG